MSDVKKMGNNVLFTYLDRASTIFVTINLDRKLEMINKKGCEILGYERKEILGKDWFDNFIPRSNRKELVAFFDQIISGTMTPPEVYENYILCKGNNRKLIRWRNALLRDDNNHIIGLISSGVDITDHTLIERELEGNVVPKRKILRALPDTIVIYDTKGTFLDVQTAKESQTFFPRKETIGKNVRDLIQDKDECKKILRALTHVDQTKKAETIETRISSPDKMIYFEARVVPFEREKVMMILRDITPSKDFEDILHIRNRALEAAGNGIVIVDAQQSNMPIIFCNQAFTQMTGYSKEEVIGLNCQFLQNDDRDQEAIESMAKAIKKGEPCRVVLRNYRKDGTLFWNEVSITPVYNDQKCLTHFIGVQNNVTEMLDIRRSLESYAKNLEQQIEEHTQELQTTVQQLMESNVSLEQQILSTKLAQEKAQSSHAMFAAIAQNFPNGIIIVFNSDFEFVYIEGQELERMALKKSDFKGLSIEGVALFSRLQKERIKQEIAKTLCGNAVSSEVNFQDQTYTVNSTPLYSESNKIAWALFVYINITEQKQIQQQLEMTLRAEQELNDLKSRFISMASHEFRTPLSAILSSAILIGKHSGPDTKARREKYVTRIRNNVKSLVDILNDFLSIDLLDEGKVKVNPNRFDLVLFSKILIDEMEGQKEEGQKIILEHSNIEIIVYMDSKLLSHILINLLSNALKYSKEGQSVTMKISLTKTETIIQVKDTGIGIPEDDQKNLFSRFFRGANVGHIPGTGLGLNIVKQYTEILGGTVSFESKIGEGTSFFLKFPITA